MNRIVRPGDGNWTLPRLAGVAAAAVALAAATSSFLLRDAMPFLTISEETYQRFWPIAPVMFLHVVGGMAAIVVGPVQFVSWVRRRYVRLHRTVGYIYFAAVMTSALTSLHVAFTVTMPRSVDFAVGLICLCICWILTAVLAYAAVLKRDFVMHKQLLVQNYTLTFAFTATRFLWDLDIAFIQNMGPMKYITMGWAGWILPFFLSIFYFQVSKVFPRGIQGKTPSSARLT